MDFPSIAAFRFCKRVGHSTVLSVTIRQLRSFVCRLLRTERIKFDTVVQSALCAQPANSYSGRPLSDGCYGRRRLHGETANDVIRCNDFFALAVAESL